VALITSILYAVYPLHHNYSQESRPYALFTLLTVCSYLLFGISCRREKLKTWFSYIVVTALLFYAKLFRHVRRLFTVCIYRHSPGASYLRVLPEIRKVGLAFVSRLLAAVTAAIALFIPGSLWDQNESRLFAATRTLRFRIVSSAS